MLKISRVILTGLVATLGTLLCLADELSLRLTSPETLQKRLRIGLVHENERESAVQALFSEVGCTGALQPVHKSIDNVICVLPGETQSTIIVGGHYDFRTEGHGIVDDWSGTALLASLYETLKDRPHKHTFKFVAFAAEEAGLVGSTRFTKSMTVEEKSGTRAFVNLECLGLTAPKVWVSRSTPELVNRLGEIASAVHVPVTGVNVDRVAMTIPTLSGTAIFR